MAYTTANILASIKQRGLTPTSQGTWTNAKYLALATEIMHIDLVPMLCAAREEYFVVEERRLLVEGEDEHDIPRRAVGMTLRDLRYDDGSGVLLNVRRIEPEHKDEAAGLSFYLRWNKIVLVGFEGRAGELVVSYQCRTGDLVDVSAAAQITAIDTVTGVCTVSNVPTSFSGSMAVDFIRSTGGHEYVAMDQIVATVGADSVSFSELPEGLSVGDWIAVSGESPVPQLPRELQPALAEAVLVDVLDSFGQHDKAQRAELRLRRMLDGAMKLITPRVKGEQKKVVSWRRGIIS